MTYYKVKKNTDTSFDVVEIQTELKIKEFTAHKEASKFAKHLEKGGGFWNHTPEFVTRTGLK